MLPKSSAGVHRDGTALPRVGCCLLHGTSELQLEVVCDRLKTMHKIECTASPPHA